MGTRADFYVKNADTLDWLGSIAWDGYPSGINAPLLEAQTEADFRTQLAAFFADRDDVTLPERGWPWPWNDSNTTDYGYVFVPEIGVIHNCFGHGWVKSTVELEWDEDAHDGEQPPKLALRMDYPDMSARKNTRFDRGSGLIIIGGPRL